MKCYKQKTNLLKDTCELNIHASYLHCLERCWPWLYGRVRKCIIDINRDSRYFHPYAYFTNVSKCVNAPVNCVYLMSPRFCGSHNPSAAKCYAIPYALSQDFCKDPLKLSFVRHDSANSTLYQFGRVLRRCYR